MNDLNLDDYFEEGGGLSGGSSKSSDSAISVHSNTDNKSEATITAAVAAENAKNDRKLTAFVEDVSANIDLSLKLRRK